jgi:hypothetical protein
MVERFSLPGAITRPFLLLDEVFALIKVMRTTVCRWNLLASQSHALGGLIASLHIASISSPAYFFSPTVRIRSSSFQSTGIERTKTNELLTTTNVTTK